MRRPVSILAIAVLSCGAGRPDEKRLEAIADAITHVGNPEIAVMIATDGLADPRAGLVPEACGEPLALGFSHADPAVRARYQATALAVCPGHCLDAKAIGTIAEAPAEKRGALILAACDAHGPDPAFGGRLADLRAAMIPSEYVLARMLLADTLAATRGTAAGAQWSKVVDDVAVGLALRGAPWGGPAPAGNARLGPGLAGAEGQIRALPARLSSCGTGHVSLRMVVSGGAVAGVAVADSTLNEAGDECVVAKLKSARFATDRATWADVWLEVGAVP